MFALKQNFTRSRLLVAQANDFFTVATDIFRIITAVLSVIQKCVSVHVNQAESIR
jgi:hypothetical protein